MFGLFRKSDKDQIQPQQWGIDCLSARPEELYAYFKTAADGLSEREAEARLKKYGLNEPAKKEKKRFLVEISVRFTNPLVVLLLVIGAFSLFFGDRFSAMIIFLMAVLSVLLSYVQEHRAEKASERLNAMVRTAVDVVRGGQVRQLQIKELVPGDIVSLSAGDVIPADLRILSAKELFLDQSSLTGESMPVEKTAGALPSAKTPSDYSAPNFAFMGTSVVSGTAIGLVVCTGLATEFGKLSKKVVESGHQTAFDQGIKDFTWLMIRAIILMVVVILGINLVDKRGFLQALLFALAVAVGLTPETLPMIVTINLSKGALDMAKKKVVVKHLDAIQNFGAMDILCTDKTGTLTMGEVVLEKYCDIGGADSEEVLEYSYINSFYQTGLKNLLDLAVLKHLHGHLHGLKKLDEIPFDFTRKIMSVVVEKEGQALIVSKGEPRHILERCGFYRNGDEVKAITSADAPIINYQYAYLSQQGFRVLAVAVKNEERPKDAYGPADEKGLTLIGYLAFLDPPKPTAKVTVGELEKVGVRIKILTGDNELVTKKICRDIGLDVEGMLVGDRLDGLSDDELVVLAEKVTVFARLMPLQKERVIRLLHQKGHVVGFLGDGINDAPALKAADVGISVNNAADVAKESASIILLKKSLVVLKDGVVEGRKVFGNIVKYIRMGSSSNFGNMLSMTGASLILPFLPMAPIQILLNNFLYDVSQTGVPADKVDQEYLQRPRVWDIGLVKRFMLTIGPVSSIFDFATFAVMWWVFRGYGNIDLFRTGWFLESLATQTLVIYVIRTRKIPFLQSSPSKWLLLTSAAVLACGFGLPYTSLARVFGLVRPPLLYYVILAGMIMVYLVLVQVVKNWFVAKYEHE